MSHKAEYWSRIASRYDGVVDLQIGPLTRSVVRERVAQEGRLGHAVELGCGTGYFTRILAAKADALLATDVSPGMLEEARRNVVAPNVAFQVEDCQSTSLPGGAFDTAFISLVLHFTEPNRVIAEMRRILKPGGLLVIASLDRRALTGLSRLRSQIRVFVRGIIGYRTRPPSDLRQSALTGQELRDLLAGSGFRVVSSETIRDPSSPANIPIEYVRAAKE